MIDRPDVYHISEPFGLACFAAVYVLHLPRDQQKPVHVVRALELSGGSDDTSECCPALRLYGLGDTFLYFTPKRHTSRF